MPIGTVDYTSTAPWNDPANPWPLYSQVSLSAAEVSLRTFTLVSFNPDTDAGNVVAHYEDATGDYFLDYDATGMQYGNDPAWTVYDALNGDTLYYKTTLTRAIPAKVVGVADGWVAAGSGTDETTLYIQPVFTSLNPWEYRRRRLLEMC
jgi:hypothetical protein